jgi:hypothetical protein
MELVNCLLLALFTVIPQTLWCVGITATNKLFHSVHTEVGDSLYFLEWWRNCCMGRWGGVGV